MKRLLLSLTLLVSFYATAQLTCATATSISVNGNITVPALTGTYGNNCWGGTTTDSNTPLKSIWYSYTPISNGEVTISSNLPVNVAPNSIDTRVSIFKGTCVALECYDGNDDVSGTNYLSSVSFPVQSGVTYYIAWDNFWSAAGFQFNFNFTAVACVKPSLLSINEPTNITTSSADLSWDVAIGTPAGYDIDYGDVGHTAGSGTIVNTTTNSLSLPSLTPSADLTYFLRSNCVGSQSSWVGPFDLYLAKQTPYGNNFDDAADNADGFTFSGWVLSTSTANAAYAQSGTAFIFSNTSTTEVSDEFAFFRPIALAAGEVITINYRTRFLGGAPNTAALSVTVGNAPTAAAQTTVVQSIASIAPATTYASQTTTWTATTAGVYYFAFHNVSGITTAVASLLVDTITTTSVLGVDEFLSSKFSVFPNPSNDVINLTNNSNIQINSINITDMNGRIVKSIQLEGADTAQVNVADLASGMYLMNIASDQGTAVKKVIKN